MQQEPLPENLKAWRVMLYRTVTAKKGLYPCNLGQRVSNESVPPLIFKGEPYERANYRLQHLEKEFKALIGEFKFTSEMLNDIQEWRKLGEIYIASDGSVSSGKGAHGFAITSGKKKAKI